MLSNETKFRRDIEKKVKQIFLLRKKNKKFIPGKTLIQYGGGVFDHKEINASVKVLIDGWFGLGKNAEKLEKNLSKFVGTKGSILTNSGSSSNFLAVASLKSHLFGSRLKDGDEIITSACGFPTTVNPIIVNRLVPVFLDIDPQTYNLNADDLEKAYTKKTRLVMIAHTLGNPNDMGKILDFCKRKNLLLVEDNCDALGSQWDDQKTGSFGILSTQSFYPPHHITMGEGGAVLYNDLRFERITRSLRDWGRSCFCRGDEKRKLGACKARFNFRIDGKPYDHKYIFNQIGYNLKPIEPQAAMGVIQLQRMPTFIKKRKDNFSRLFNYAKEWTDFFILPKALPKATPCWFSFPLTIRDGIRFTRREITSFLENKMIQTRPLFAGNITKQPAYYNIHYKKVGDLENATRVLHNTFFLGIYPALGNREIDYIAENIKIFLKKFK